MKTRSKGQLAQMARVMDRVMTGARSRVKAPRVLAEQRLTAEQIRDIGSKVSLRHIAGKGLGLVARKHLAPHTRIGMYAGKVYSAKAHQRLSDSGVTTGKYAIDFYKRSEGGRVSSGYVMDPGVGDGLHPTHANVLAAFINEPSAGQQPNVVWVRNYATGTMELWTTREVKAGEEVTACYGTHYPRGYKTACTANPGSMHYVSATQRVPVRVPR